MESTNFSKYDFLAKLGLEETNNGCYTNGEWLGGDVIVDSIFPHDNSVNAKVRLATAENYEYCIQSMLKEKKKWMNTPAPVRGDILRQVGAKLKEFQDEIGSLIALEVGKTKPEGDFEPGDSFNVCNYACGLSRDIAGRIAPSEKPGHVILENWNPLGIVGVITAFNFPCLVFCWTAVNALMCGNMVLWKGAPTTPLCSIAISKIFVDVLKENGFNSVFSLCQGDGVEIGQLIANDKRVPLVSFTGSVKVGKIVSAAVNKRMGRCLLELGGNNAAIVLKDANIDHAVQEIYAFNLQVSGQCCTSIRRVLIEESVYDEVVEKLVAKYKATVAGDPFDSNSNMGPLHSKLGIDIYTKAIKAIKEQGGKILTGGNVTAGDGNYVEATVVEIDRNSEIVQEETFAPIVYVFKIKDLDDAIEYNNSVSQGLNSTLFTNDLRNYFKWIGPGGSDCGLVNCNISEGAETGCAFGGEKETGGGRVSGSDSWKQYMRRSTCMLNYSVTN